MARAGRHRDRLRRRRGRRRGRRGDRAGARARLPDDRVRAARARSGSSLPPSDDPSVRQELVETLYHVLWELVHVFFEHRGLLEGREARRGARHRRVELPLSRSSPSRSTTSRRCVDDVRRSVLAKAEEIGELREQTLTENRDELRGGRRRPARRLRRRRQAAGARQRRLGHRRDGRGGRLPRPARRRAGGRGRAIDLTEDPAILTAIANDIGTEAIFARQVIAYGRRGRRRCSRCRRAATRPT